MNSAKGYLHRLSHVPDQWLKSDWVLQIRDAEFSRILQKALPGTGYPAALANSYLLMPGEVYAAMVESRNPLSPWLHVRAPFLDPDQACDTVWHYVRGLDHIRPILHYHARMPPTVLPGGYVVAREDRTMHQPFRVTDEWRIRPMIEFMRTLGIDLTGGLDTRIFPNMAVTMHRALRTNRFREDLNMLRDTIRTHEHNEHVIQRFERYYTHTPIDSDPDNKCEIWLVSEGRLEGKQLLLKMQRLILVARRGYLA